MPKKENSKITLSLSIKLLIPLTVLTTIIFILGYFGLQQYLKKTIYGILEEETSSIIDYTQACLDEDVLKSLIQDGVEYDETANWPQGMTDERYWDQQGCLEAVDEFNPRTEMFTYYVIDDNTLAFGLDQWATIDPENSFPFGEVIDKEGNDDYDKLLLGLEGIYHYDELKYDQENNGYYYATIIPLQTSSREVIGGLVVYLDANWVTEGLQNLSNILLLIFAIIYILVVLLVLLITRNTTSKLVELKAAASRVADGDYAPITLKSQPIDDEVSTLAMLFNIMLDKVRGREEVLKQQVVELKIQIDAEKRKKAVKEIVESEFFQDLQSRATQMRKRTKKK
jgi:methyl-accepting chemotaxis protein